MTPPAALGLFTRLMPSRAGASTGQPRCFGREDYITEVVAPLP